MIKVVPKVLITIFALTIGFHLLVITGVIPFDIVWGGRLETYDAMIQFETFSIMLNLFFLFIVALKIKKISHQLPSKLINGVLWFMTVLFSLNTLGNLASLNSLETIIFTPITLVLAIGSGILAKQEY